MVRNSTTASATNNRPGAAVRTLKELRYAEILSTQDLRARWSDKHH